VVMRLHTYGISVLCAPQGRSALVGVKYIQRIKMQGETIKFVYVSLHCYVLSCTENVSNWITRDRFIEENKG
jgi:hypothetical protein